MPRKSLAVALAAALCMMLLPGQSSAQSTVATSVRVWKIAGVGPGGPAWKVFVFGKLSSGNPQCVVGQTIAITAGNVTKNDTTDTEGEFGAGFRVRGQGRIGILARYLGQQAPSYNATYSGAVSCGASSDSAGAKPPNANKND